MPFVFVRCSEVRYALCLSHASPVVVRTVAGGRRLNPHSPSATTPRRTVIVMMTEYETQSTLYLKKVELYLQCIPDDVVS